MTTLQEAVKKFIEATKLDRIEFEDWPRDSQTAFETLRAALAQHEADKPFQPDWTNYRQGVEDGKAEALAQQGEQRCTYCDGTGDVHGIDGEWRGSCPCAAAPAPQAQEPAEWRTEAVKWIRRKAEDQRAENEQNPRHAEAYPSWGERVRQWHWLADDLELEQNSPPFGLEPYQEPAPQAQPATVDIDAYRSMNGEL